LKVIRLFIVAIISSVIRI